jgi:GAF domain-containing protein
VLNALLWAVLAAAVLWAPVRVVAGSTPLPTLMVDALLVLLVVAAVAVSQVLLRSGRLRQASLLLVGILYVGPSLLVALSGGVRSPAVGLYVLPIAVAAVLLGPALALVVAAMAVLTGLAFLYAELSGGWLMPVTVAPLLTWGVTALVLGALGAVLVLAERKHAALLDAARRQTEDLQAQRAQLLETGRARTAALDRQIRNLGAVAAISREIAPLTDVAEILARTVSLTADHLGLYHVGAYAIDEQGAWLDLLASADPEAEDPPPWEPRVIVDGTGIVGRVATTARPYLASGARAEARDEDGGPGETRARLALPITARTRVLGVLDMHSRVQGTFQPDDAAVFAMLADQVAAAWMHATALREAQQHGEAARAALGQSVAASWRRAAHVRRPTGVLRTHDGFATARGGLSREATEALGGQEIVVSEVSGLTAAVPVLVRGEVVAVLEAMRPAQTGRWSRQDLSLLEALSVQLGEALESARLYEDVRRREAQERLLGEATARMRASLDPETVLRTGVEEIREALGLAALDIRIDPGQGVPGDSPPAE